MHYTNIIKRLSLILSITISVNAYALDESRYSHELTNELFNFLEKQGERKNFVGSGDINLTYQSFTSNCNGSAVFLIPGWSEPFAKYAETIVELTGKGFCVHTYDHRGQGYSQRQLDNGQIGHVDDFSEYVSDLEMFYQLIITQHKYEKIFYIAHSMGGLIAISHILRYSPKVDSVILTAPMLQVNTDFWPQSVAYAIASSLDWMGFGEVYVFGHGDYREKEFHEIKTTTSQARFEFEKNLLKTQPQLIVSGVSNRWLMSSIKQTQTIKTNWQKLQQRILLFQAGKEHFVINSANDEFCKTVKNCQKIYYKDARHELLMEKDKIRNSVMKNIFDFIK